MDLQAQFRADLISAMKSGQGLRVSVLRMLLSELNYKKIDIQKELSDTDVTGVIQREVKKRREAIESYQAGSRLDQAKQEAEEMELLLAYLPKMLSEEELRAEIAKVAEVKSGAEFGQVMRVVSPLFKGKADGGLVAKIVKEMVA